MMFLKYLLICGICVFVASSEIKEPPALFDLKHIFSNIHSSDFINIDALDNFFENLINEYDSETDSFVERDFTPNAEGRVAAVSGPNVTIPVLGTVVGKTMKSFFGRDVFAFQSIPYAQPPVGNLRFKMPVSWDGPWVNDGNYDGTFLRAKCPQGSMVMPVVGGREDCLHLSVYTPNLTPDKKYPVMFFIHGGAFMTGDASLYVPTKLIDRDVVIVVIQYRLASLGFLSSGTPDAPGNMGLMDQVMALRWVKKYIEYFGGNKNKVTVFGQSAGGASASWMMFTPRTNSINNGGSALLKGVIAESGSAIEAWTLDPDPSTSFILQATAVGCYSETLNATSDVLKCMRGLSYSELIKGANKVANDDMASGGLGFLGNCPVVQKDLIANFPQEIIDNPDLVVVPEHPLVLLEKGEYLDVNVMTGSVRDEGILVLALAYGYFVHPNNLENNKTFMADAFTPGIVNAFGIPDITGSVSNSLRLAFLRDADMGNWDSMNGGLVDMLGMMFLKSGLWQLTHLLKLKNPLANIYFYSFEFESDDSIYDWYFFSSPDIPIIRGITHADELLYLFHLPSVMDERQKVTVRRLTKLWSNFAKYGDPTPKTVDAGDEWVGDVEKWQPFSLSGLNFMYMNDNFTMDSDYTLKWNYNSNASGKTTIFR